MFDPVTAELIRRAPALPGLDPQNLVNILTQAYIEIAAARLKVNNAGVEGEKDQLDLLAANMGRLADAYEAAIVLGAYTEFRQSAAFVAGSARQVLSQIARIGGGENETSRLDGEAIGAELAAALLFLVAERSSDAFEASREIKAAGMINPVRRALTYAVGLFARGQFSALVEIDPDREKIAFGAPEEAAIDLLYRELLRGLVLLANVGLGLIDREAAAKARELFYFVFHRSTFQQSNTPDGSDHSLKVRSVFAGPYHLAGLLIKAADSFEHNILVGVSPPSGASSVKWSEWLGEDAKRWPYLWVNHRDAVATGYLDQGKSLVMTTPTGSGKSTIATLKIVATLAAGKTVLYLAPTHALVSQIEDDLNRRVVGLAKAENIDSLSLDETVQILPDIAVVTPERCFALLTFAPEIFANVGLFVFDEFHLLGVSRPAFNGSLARVDRRGIDAMLCLLTYQSICKDSDYLLLSAMVSNGAVVADWLSTQIDRTVIAFDYKWKPTRQLRSCLVYDRDELRAQRFAINGLPRPKSAEAQPYGLFSLTSGWNPDAPDKLVLRAFSNTPLRLGIGSKGLRRWLTANRYQVAAAIAKRFADSGLKVLVFCESIVACGSVANRLNQESGKLNGPQDAEHKQWREDLVEEVGKESAIYDVGEGIAAVHHGELLPLERRLVETSFKSKESGLNVLAATSTLAQGLNLPCDVVIIAASDRIDDNEAEEVARVPLMPHEIINALGRAGRAGQSATGFSIVIPSNPLECNLDTKAVSSDDELKVIFAEGDQCLPLDDPLTTLFDQIEVGGAVSMEAEYLVKRLAITLSDKVENNEAFEKLTRRTFGYYRQKSVDAISAETWLAERKKVLLRRLAAIKTQEALPWQEELAARTGASPTFIARLAAVYDEAPHDSAEADVWVDWILSQLDVSTNDVDAFLRPETVGRVFGRAYTKQKDVQTARKIAIKGVRIALAAWFAGESLCEIEEKIANFVAAEEPKVTRSTTVDKKAKRARRFALRLAPDLGFMCGVFAQVAIKASEDRGIANPPMPSFLSQLVRLGYLTPYHYALSADLESKTRAKVNQAFEAISDRLGRSSLDGWDDVRQKLEGAKVLMMLAEFSGTNLDGLFKGLGDGSSKE